MKRAAFCFFLLLASGLIASSVWAEAVEDDREASFVPPPTVIMAVPQTKDAEAAKALSVPPSAPKAASAVAALPPAVSSDVPQKLPEPAGPQDQPIASIPLADVDPETIGLIYPDNGGLLPSIWNGTNRFFADRLFQGLNLPVNSPTMNGLVRRLLLSEAAPPAPEGDYKPTKSLIAQRIEKLLALGDVQDAWDLAQKVDAGKIDSVNLRQLAEAAIIGPDSKEICDKVPGMIAAHAKPDEADIEWQKTLLVCQYRAGDLKAMQLSLDVMREQKVRDDTFMMLMNRNVLGGSKQLPRQMTPLRPLYLAVLRQLGDPLPSEFYGKPEALMIPELLQAKSSDEAVRLSLAEKSAAKGIISSTQMAAVYKSLSLPPEDIQGAAQTLEVGTRTRAALYQAALAEALPQKRLEMAQKFMAGIEAGSLTGSMGQIIVDMVGQIPVVSDWNLYSAFLAKTYALAGKPEIAMQWFKLAQEVGDRLPEVGKQMQQNWPLFVLSGLVGDGDYAKGMKAWLDGALAEKEESNPRLQKERTQSILTLLLASGYAVPEEAWQRTLDITPPVKQPTPSALLVERMHQSAQAGRLGETIMLASLLAGGGIADTPMNVMVEAVRALRLVGLTAESLSLARETLMGVGLP